MQPDDENFLRQTFALARAARAAGHRPFGAVVADAAGIVAEAGSTQTANGDPTAHAEMNALRRAMAVVPRARLEGATLYASNEPCAMCAAAAFYAGVARIVFGFPEEKLRPLRNRTAAGAGIGLSCRAVLARPARKVEVVGPCLEDEAALLHDGYWSEATA
ncbi:MAG: nucleoside deaminase [Telmatospirillum sp.]|nr:nucleoside deaminase [Telmatospirillum sp.]